MIMPMLRQLMSLFGISTVAHAQNIPEPHIDVERKLSQKYYAMSFEPLYYILVICLEEVVRETDLSRNRLQKMVSKNISEQCFYKK